MVNRSGLFRVFLAILAAVLLPLKGALALSGLVCHLMDPALAMVQPQDPEGCGHAAIDGAESIGDAGNDLDHLPPTPVAACPACAFMCSTAPFLCVNTGGSAILAAKAHPQPASAIEPPARPPGRPERPPRHA